MRIENLGQSTLRDIRARDDLGATFAAAQGFVVDAVRSSKFTVNPAYDGRTDIELLAASDSLSVGDAGAIEIDVTVRPGAALGPYDNTAVGSGINPSGVAISDASTDGVDVDPNGNGDPGDDRVATRLSFAETPRVGLAKTVQLQPEENDDGTWAVAYRFFVRNMGDVVLRQSDSSKRDVTTKASLLTLAESREFIYSIYQKDGMM